MHDTAIELLIIGNQTSEVEGYLNALRNSGHAVHAEQIIHHLDHFKASITKPIDLILYTSEPGELGIKAIREILDSKRVTAPILILSEISNTEHRAKALSQGAKDLIERNAYQLTTQVILREYTNVMVSRDRDTLQQKLIEAENRCRLLTEHSRDAIGYIHEGMHITANSAYLQLFGLTTEEDIAGIPILDMVALPDHQKVKKLLRNLTPDSEEEQQITCKCLGMDGIEFNADLRFIPTTLDGEFCFQISIQRQSHSIEVEEKIRQLSTRDSQTNLYNRQYFLQLLEESCHSQKASMPLQHLFYITLDNFKEIRNQLGILISDGIIQETASVLRKLISDLDILARFGDHTFTLLTQLQGDEIVSLARNIQNQINAHPYDLEDLTIKPTCSIGVVNSHPGYGSANEFINAAYQACERAKIEGGNQYYLEQGHITPSHSTSGSEADLEQLILHALKKEQFRLLYQPIVSLHGDTRENYAVLVRLLDNNQEEIQPGHFFSQMETMGRQPDIDRWVIRKAISEISNHRNQGNKINFFINISGGSLEGDALLLWICDCLQEFDAKGSWLTFQFHDEDVRNGSHELRKLFDGLKKIKCKISIDQFGLAPKPEALLYNLPIDYVQFSQELMEGLAESQDDQDRLYELNHLVQDLNVRTIASSVDDANSLAVLWSIGVNYICGYFVQEPTPTINYDFRSESTIL